MPPSTYVLAESLMSRLATQRYIDSPDEVLILESILLPSVVETVQGNILKQTAAGPKETEETNTKSVVLLIEQLRQFKRMLEQGHDRQQNGITR